MPAGDDLTIVLFFIGVAVSIALAAMSAANWRQWVLVSIAAVCLAAGLGWTNLKTVSPLIADGISRVATNPFAWFIILMLAVASLRFIPQEVSPRSRAALFGTPKPVSSPKIETDNSLRGVEPSLSGDVGLTDLMGVYRGRTKIQADALVQHHIGRLVEVSGKLDDVRLPNGKSGEVMVSIDNATIFAIFSNTFYDRLAFIPHGAQVSLKGHIRDISPSSVGLDNCNLIAVNLL